MHNKYYKGIIAIILMVILFHIICLVFNTEYFLTQATMCAYYSMAIIGLCLLMGYAGQISLGHSAFFVIGGYTTAVLTTFDLGKWQNIYIIQLLEKLKFLIWSTDLYNNQILHFAPVITFICAILIAALTAFLIGVQIIKLKGHYLAMATLGFAMIVYRIILGSSMLGEADGISNVPAFNIFNLISISGNFQQRVANYYAAWAVLIISLWFLFNIINSRIGRALRSIHGNEEASQTMGVYTAKYKLLIFILSAVYAAVGGFFLTHYNGGIGPSEAGIIKSVRYVAIVSIGGMGNLWGVLCTGIVLNFLSLRGVFGSYDDFFFGAILILIVILAPDGLLSKNNIYYILRMLKKWFNKNENTLG